MQEIEPMQGNAANLSTWWWEPCSQLNGTKLAAFAYVGSIPCMCSIPCMVSIPCMGNPFALRVLSYHHIPTFPAIPCVVFHSLQDSLLTCTYIPCFPLIGSLHESPPPPCTLCSLCGFQFPALVTFLH